MMLVERRRSAARVVVVCIRLYRRGLWILEGWGVWVDSLDGTAERWWGRGGEGRGAWVLEVNCGRPGYVDPGFSRSLCERAVTELLQN